MNDATRAEYEARGANPFTYEIKGRVITMSYYEVPPEVLESQAEVTDWALQAVQAAREKPAAKRGK